MQFTALVAFVFAASATYVSAAPTATKRLSCPILDCVEALAPTVEGCGPAVISLGADVGTDITCLEDAASLAVSFPASCAACAAELGVTSAIGSAAGAVESAASGVVGDIEGLF